MRTIKVRVLIEILFLILSAALIYLQLIKGDFYYSLSNKNCIRVIPSQGARGRILDRRGEILVTNKLSYNISIIPQEFKRNEDTLLKLSSYLKLPVSQINKIIQKNLTAAFNPIIIAKDIDKELAMLIEEDKFNLPGVIVEIIPRRSYPYRNLACHVIGYLSEIDRWRITRLKDYGYKNKDLVGFGGVEEFYDQNLRAIDGGTQIQVDHRGRMNRILGYKPPSDGRDVLLTIDIRIQKIVEEELSQKKGAVIMMEPDTGRIIAMASAPGFSPGGFLTQESRSDYIGSLLIDSQAPLVNRAISGRYPLGSVFKIICATAALDKKKITPDKRFFCPGKIFVGDREFKCMEAHNSQNLKEALVHSCNVYFYRLALLLGPDILSEYAQKFGFGKPGGIDLLYAVSGNVPSPLSRKMQFKSWYDGDTANFGIGQGDLLVSPLQALKAIAAFINGGKLVKPYIVESISGKKIEHELPVKLDLNDSALETVRLSLRQAVEQETGTAHIVELEGCKVAGKTGTAQVSGKLAHGLFVGFLPYDKPKIVFCIFLENSGSSAYACMLARQIFVRILNENLL